MIRRMTSNLILVTCLYVRVTNRLGIWTDLPVLNPAAHLLPVPVRGTSESYVGRPHNADCYDSASSEVLTGTER